MNISAVTCSPIRPQATFGSLEFQKYDEINEKFVKSNDIKNPASIAVSVAVAIGAPYCAGKKITNMITSKKFAQNAGEKFEAGLKKISLKMQKESESLKNTSNNKKLSSLKKYTGNILGAFEEGARILYKKLAYSTIPQNVEKHEKANLALSNMVGTAIGSAAVVNVCKRDSNNDGVNDVIQKSQNVYTGTKNTYSNTVEALNVISEVAEVLM